MGIQIGNLTLYTVEDLGQLMGIQEKTIRKLLKEGKLKGRKMARRWFVTEEALREYFGNAEGAGEK